MLARCHIYMPLFNFVGGPTFRQMNLNLYDMISGVLLSFTEENSFTIIDVEKYQNFYRKNKIRFNHKKCNDRPFFELKKIRQ